jgi:hypothetical protein
MSDTSDAAVKPETVKRAFRMIDGSRYEVEAGTECEAIAHVERIFGKKTWNAIEIIPRRGR